MWIRYSEFSERDNHYITALGRALVLAQHFEMTCKEIVMWFDIATMASKGTIKTVQDIKESSEILLERMLASTIKHVGTNHKISDGDIEVLAKAKDARNFIAHQAANPVLMEGIPASAFVKSVEELRTNAEPLAYGDNLVSSWSYEFHEQECRPHLISTAYPAETLDWVMEPLKGMANRRCS